MQEDMIHAFWARGNEHFSWRRECMTWHLPTFLALYGNKHTLRTLYNYWCDLPIALTKDYRGKNASESATAQRQKNWHQAQRLTVDFLKSTGIPHPETTEEWKTIVSEMGKWMAMSAIHSHTPAAVMELPVSATRDSKEAMLFRALCDERITLPAELFRDTPIHERIERLYGGGIIEARRYWRCNTEHFWTAKVTDTWLTSALYHKLGYSHQEIQAKGLPAPEASGELVGGVQSSILRTTERRDRHTMPPLTTANVSSVTSANWRKANGYEASDHVLWGRAECGLVLPSVSCWEVIGRHVGVTKGGYMCSYCRGFWKARKGGTRVVQLTGRKADQRVRLQLILDEPPEELENKWIDERLLQYYMRCEPHAPPRDERMEASGGPRLRFSSSNGMGQVAPREGRTPEDPGRSQGGPVHPRGCAMDGLLVSRRGPLGRQGAGASGPDPTPNQQKASLGSSFWHSRNRTQLARQLPTRGKNPGVELLRGPARRGKGRAAAQTLSSFWVSGACVGGFGLTTHVLLETRSHLRQ